VQGVGARLAVALLGVLSSEEIGRAIAERDARTIARAPGIGKRVAERIVVELADKVAKMPVAGEGRGASPAASVAPASAEDQAAADARSALVNLGYADEAARAAVARVRAERPEAGLATATLIRESLKVLSQ
jgi:Holliday junction DNA helicase RuvA